MRHAKMPMQDHKENCMWRLPAMNTSADTACIRTGVDQQNIHQKICLKTHDEFLMNYKESLQESVQCEVRRRISKHNCRTAHRGSVLFLGPVDRVPVELRSPRKNKKSARSGQDPSGLWDSESAPIPARTHTSTHIQQ